MSCRKIQLATYLNKSEYPNFGSLSGLSPSSWRTPRDNNDNSDYDLMFKAALEKPPYSLGCFFVLLLEAQKHYNQNINVSSYLLFAISAFCLATSAAFCAALTAASTLSRIFPDLNVKILDELRPPVDDATSMLFLYLPSILIPAIASNSPMFQSST